MDLFWSTWFTAFTKFPFSLSLEANIDGLESSAFVTTDQRLLWIRLQVLKMETWGATIAQWICLRLPFCCPGFESQAHNLLFYYLQ